MPIDFSVLTQAPTIAQGFLAGQQAAQQQAEQNRLRDMQMLQMEAQRENILAQRAQREQQLRERTAAEARTNELRRALESGDEAALIKLGPDGIEAATKLAALNKARGEVFTQRMSAARQFLDTLDPNDPTAPQRFLQWHEANHRDPIIGPMLAARGITADQARARIEQAVQQGPQAFANLIAQSKLGTEKFMEMNAPKFFTQNLGGTEQIVSTPGLGGAAQVVPGSVAVKTLTPGESKLFTPEEEAQRIRIALASRPPAQPKEPPAPMPVVDPATGQVKYVPREQAVGMTPPAFMESLTPKERQVREAKFPQATSALKAFDNTATTLIKDLETLANHPGLPSITGIAAGRLPGLTAQGREAQALYDKIMARGGFQELQNMRQASPTGGALGNVSNAEGERLQAAFAALDRRQDAPSVRKAIRDAITQTQTSKQNLREAYDLTYEYKQRGGATPAAAPAAAPNIDALLNKYR